MSEYEHFLSNMNEYLAKDCEPECTYIPNGHFICNCSGCSETECEYWEEYNEND